MFEVHILSAKPNGWLHIHTVVGVAETLQESEWRAPNLEPLREGSQEGWAVEQPGHRGRRTDFDKEEENEEEKES